MLDGLQPGSVLRSSPMHGSGVNHPLSVMARHIDGALMGQRRLSSFLAMAWPAAKTHAVAFRQFNWQGKIRGAGGTIYCQPYWEMIWGRAVQPLFLLCQSDCTIEYMCVCYPLSEFATTYIWLVFARNCVHDRPWQAINACRRNMVGFHAQESSRPLPWHASETLT